MVTLRRFHLWCARIGACSLPWLTGSVPICAAEPAVVRRAGADDTAEINRLIDKIRSDAQVLRADAANRPAPLDAGIAGSKNFTVLQRGAPRGERLAQAVLERAEALRKEIALQWLGEELPPGREVVHITVELSSEEDRGLTLLCGPGRALRGDHRMWLTTSRERALGSTLAHEMTHVVLAARFPRGMPVWANEGIASLCDDAQRGEDRRQLWRQWAREGRFPELEKVLYAASIAPTDETAYAVGVSVTEYLLSRGDRARLIQFVEQGQRDGWDAALRDSYGLADVGELERHWQAWLMSNP
jgi:hypothetical protein